MVEIKILQNNYIDYNARLKQKKAIVEQMIQVSLTATKWSVKKPRRSSLPTINGVYSNQERDSEQ